MSSVAVPGERPAEQTRSRAGGLPRPLRDFLTTEAGGASVLLAATVLALVWANSPLAGSYEALWATELAITLGGAELSLDLRHWVNDGLMVFFFFVIGLEVRRELSMGELTDRHRAVLPAVAAVAGLLVPVGVYLAFTAGGPGAQGFGAAMATDTAFMLGALALVGPRCPTQLRVFLLTVAVFDDIGAIGVIALFYTEGLDVVALAIALGFLGGVLLLRRLRVWRAPGYLVVGIGLWVATVASGVHPSVAGIVLGLLTPAYPPARDAVQRATQVARSFGQSPTPGLARSAKLSMEAAVSSNERLTHLLHPWTSYVVVPIFALANAGIALDGGTLGRALTSPVAIGILVALVAGKLLGVGLVSWVVVRSGVGALPRGVESHQLAGAAAIAGIGFTVSLFIVDLAFAEQPALREEAKVGILFAGLAAAALGWALFRTLGRRGSATAGGLPTRLDRPVDPERDHVRGPADAPLTLVEYADFECPFCGRATGVVDELLERFGDELRYVFRHLPLTDVHPNASVAAEAAEAAAVRGRFWALHDRLYAHQDALEPDDLVGHAAAIGLDAGAVAEELDQRLHAERVAEDALSAEAGGARGTPTFFVGERRHTGPWDADTLAARLEAERDRLA
ncbi:MAG TPA: Na+/H+ antiporter NhaA [Solirubrobacteraceae bacterium]|nr:Na+/H+ antiporter NhaA [Solirubrobacteraceae bacterium]